MNEKEIMQQLVELLDSQFMDKTMIAIPWPLLRVLLKYYLVGDAAKQTRGQSQQIEVGDFITFRNGDELQTGRVDRVVYRVKINDALVIMVGASEITNHEKGQP